MPRRCLSFAGKLAFTKVQVLDPEEKKSSNSFFLQRMQTLFPLTLRPCCHVWRREATLFLQRMQTSFLLTLRPGCHVYLHC